ncbi:tetratricopeptide (TPR) repeat protein [Rhodoblastus sphagnicola]|nr:tetratricopeptide (TPR) repeat protein [Rhodoblastus sphagnicola]
MFAEEGVLSHAIFGGGLPLQAERALEQAGLNYADPQTAEAFLRDAEAAAPDHFAVLIGWYRYFFYKGRLEEALAIGKRCLTKTAREKNFCTDWRDVRATDADFGCYDDVMARFFMFCLKGYAYLHLRLGDLDEGRAAAEKLLELDPTDRVNAKLLLDVLQRAESGNE